VNSSYRLVGTVNERFSKNSHIPTGEIEIIVSELNILNSAITPPFTIEDNTDGGDDIRMKYRYLTYAVVLFVQIWNYVTK